MSKKISLLSPLIVVSALGYFVDTYDLLLFSIVRMQSLKSIGVPDSELMSTGVTLVNLQMAGLLLGGFLWGVLGDQKGRLKTLYGSIFLYSIANLLNAFVTSVPQYAVLRFIAGIGLAGELGVAVTLVAESLPQSKRGMGTALIAGIGLAGAAAAGVMAELFDWRTCYGIGGVMSFLLLLGRLQIQESPLFEKQKSSRKHPLKVLLFNPKRAWLFVRCILVGVPLWFTSGILITFAPEIATALGVPEPISVGRGILICYGTACFGDLLAGLLSQKLKSRKKVIGLFLLGTLLGSILFLTANGKSAAFLYGVCALIGFSGGYWALFVLTTAEQFGTNIRATVTSSAPNLVRGALILLTLSFRGLTPSLGVLASASWVGAVCLILAYLSLFSLPETANNNLDFSD